MSKAAFSVLAIALAFFPLVGRASTQVSYTPIAAPNVSPDATATGGITGSVDAWSTTLPSEGSGSGALFVSSGSLATSWGLYSVSQEALAQHNFAGGNINLNQTISLSFANQSVTTGNRVGINLLSGGSTLFSLYFQGGQTNYQYNSFGVTGGNTGRAYASDTFLTFNFTLTSATAYTASFGGASWTGTIANNPITGIQVANNARLSLSGSNNGVYFKGLGVNTVPEPTTIPLLMIGGSLLLARRRRIRLAGAAHR